MFVGINTLQATP